MDLEKIEQTAIFSKVGEAFTLPPTVKYPISEEAFIELEVSYDEKNEIDIHKEGIYTLRGKIKQEEYPNPLVEQRADPHIYKHKDGYYYFTGSCPVCL